MFRAFTGPVGLYRAYSSIIVAIRCITGPGYSSPWPREESNVISGPGIGDRPPSKQLEGCGPAISPLLWTQPAAFALDEIHLRQGYARLCKAMQGSMFAGTSRNRDPNIPRSPTMFFFLFERH
jgi:hypothetical protein